MQNSIVEHRDFVAIASKFFGVGKYDDGCKILRQGLGLRYSNLASTLILARELSLRRLHSECLQLLDCIPLDEMNAEAFQLRGNSALQLGRPSDAEPAYTAAVKLDPQAADALIGLATLRWSQNFDDDARALAKSALKADNNNSRALVFNAGLSLFDDDFDAFERGFASARASTPKDPNLEHSYATGLLRRGVWSQGWHAYKKRESFSLPYVFRKHSFPQTLEDCAGKTVCLLIEQGFGDVIQFFRYVEILDRLGADVHVRCHERLHRLLSSSCVNVTFHDAIKRSADFDYVLPLFDIPCMLDWSSEQHFGKTPYLHAEDQLKAKWAPRLACEGPKIAIAWQGNPNTAVDIGRSLPDEALAALLADPSATFFSIQKGDAEHIAREKNLPNNLRFLDGLDEGPDAFVDTAAVMQCVDLVLTTDTSVAHLAGALGVRCAIMLQARPDWRWGESKRTTKWYPSATLLRQSTHGNWASVVADAIDVIEGL